MEKKSATQRAGYDGHGRKVAGHIGCRVGLHESICTHKISAMAENLAVEPAHAGLDRRDARKGPSGISLARAEEASAVHSVPGSRPKARGEHQSQRMTSPDPGTSRHLCHPIGPASHPRPSPPFLSPCPSLPCFDKRLCPLPSRDMHKGICGRLLIAWMTRTLPKLMIHVHANTADTF
jgi:hypothetical protein